MKKTVLSLAFLSIFTGSVMAQETNENEDVLNNVLQQLLKSEDKGDKKPDVIKKQYSSEQTKPEVQAVTKKIESTPVQQEIEGEKLVEVVEQPKMQLVQESSLENLEVEAIMNGDMIIQDIHTSEKELNTEGTPEHFFMLNVPVETKLTANVDLILPPFRDKMAYTNGKSTSTDPFEYTSKATFCYLNLEKSGVWRRFKSDESKYLKVVSNVSNKKLYQYNTEDSREVITVYETVFTFDNEHIKNLICKSSESELPLTLGDLHKATGNLFSFEITPMLDI